MRFKPPKHSAAFFALILLAVSILSIPFVRAASPLTFIANTSVDDCGPNGTCNASPTLAITTNDLLMAAEVISAPCNQLQTNGIVVSSTPSETWTIASSQQFTGIGGSPFCLGFISATAHSTTAYTFTVAGGTAGTPMGPVTFLDYRGTFNGFGTSTGDTLPSSGASGSDTLSMNVQAASVILELDSFGNSASNCGSTTTSNGQSLRHKACNLDGNFGGRGLIADTNEATTAGAGSVALSIGWSGWGSGASGGHLLLEMKSVSGQVTSNITVVCFGNCGTPAVTLVNTNSTHSVAFNQSITLFYEFQPSVSGFMVNVTTNLAKNYPTSFYAPSLAFYGSGFCPIGTSPGTSQCPFQQLAQGFSTSFAKGSASILGGSNFPVTSGQWYAVAISARITGLDVNDTNTNVQMFQSSGLTPPVMSQSAAYGLVKIGLWTWIQASIINSIPPPPPSTSCATSPQLDCILTGAVNSFCSSLTVACQTSSALLLMILLSGISLFVLVYFLNQVMPGVNLARLGLGEIGILIFLAWFAVFTSFSLIPVYLMMLTFFVVSLLFGKRVASYV